VPGVRAALCNDLFTARLSREHNDANVLSMGGRIVAFALADEILELWLKTPFAGGRHQRRIDQISAAERRPDVQVGRG
jgi:ribose 5-phosphate isomerase B